MNYLDMQRLGAQRDAETVIRYDAEMRKRIEETASKPDVQWFPGFNYVEKRPVDTHLLDGKKQRVFYNPNPYFGLAAARESAQAQLTKRPLDSREFPEDPTW